MQLASGEAVLRERGTPQGGVISPVVANLFLHYVLDAWLTQCFPNVPWCRYADDGLLHCKTEEQARFMLKMLERRMAECGLTLDPEKTKIVYRKDGRRNGQATHTQFDFLGYTFQRRSVRASSGKQLQLGFMPAVSKAALNAMRQRLRKLRVRQRTALSLQPLARGLNPILRGWLAYYGAFYRSEMYRLVRHFNKSLVRWAMRKCGHLKRHKSRAIALLERVNKQRPQLFAHWQQGMSGAFA